MNFIHARSSPRSRRLPGSYLKPSGNDSIGQGSGRLLSTTDAAPESSKYRFNQGDVLFGRLRAYLRKFWLAAFDGLCSTEI